MGENNFLDEMSKVVLETIAAINDAVKPVIDYINNMSDDPEEQSLEKQSLEKRSLGENGILIPVEYVNWADEKIDRSGIIPIFRDGEKIFVGLGVSSNTANIITLGGSFEATDYDLLSTAVREYNEEVGKNMRKIKEEDLMGCFAIKSEHDINILFPIEKIPESFEKTEELENIIWITLKQFEIMINNSNLSTFGIDKFGHKKQFGIKLFSINVDLKLIGGRLLGVLNEIKTLRSRLIENNLSFTTTRTRKKLTCKDSTVYGIEHLEIFKQKLGGTTILVISDNQFLFEDSYERLYSACTEDLPKFLEKSKELKTNITILLQKDLNHPKVIQYKDSLKFHPVDFEIRRHGINPLLIKVNKIKNIRKEKSDASLLIELQMLKDIEYEIYQHSIKNKTRFSFPRAKILNNINILNKILRSKNCTTKMLDRIFGKFERKSIIDILVKIGFYEQIGGNLKLV